MRYLHTMVRVTDLETSLAFYRDALGMVVTRRIDNESGRYTLVYLAAPADEAGAKRDGRPELELTHNWPDAQGNAEAYSGGRNFGHMAFEVDDIHATCQRLDGSGHHDQSPATRRDDGLRALTRPNLDRAAPAGPRAAAAGAVAVDGQPGQLVGAGATRRWPPPGQACAAAGTGRGLARNARAVRRQCREGALRAGWHRHHRRRRHGRS